MNKKHLQNLTRLANFLETEITDKQFDIRDFKVNMNEKTWYGDFKTCSLEEHECGTVGCAIGWSPIALNVKKSTIKKLDWHDFSEKYFNCNSMDDNVGQYMFSGDWYYMSRGRSRKATIKRIREVVENKGQLTKKMEKTIDKLEDVFLI